MGLPEEEFPLGNPVDIATNTPPKIFSVSRSADNVNLIFRIGDPPGSVRRRFGSHYRIYFASIDLAGPAQIANPVIANNVFHQASLILEFPAGPEGTVITASDSRYAGIDGWFFGVAVSFLNIETIFVGPVRNPIIGTNDRRVPPDIFDQTVTFLDGGLDPAGRQLVKARCTCKVPSQSNGVSNVQMVNIGRGYGGTGYTHDFFVIFLDGGGSGAAGLAHVRDGAVHDVEVTASGADYTSPPTVDFSNGDGIGAAAFAFLTTTGSISGVQIYLGNYFSVGIVVEAAEFAINAPQPGDSIEGDLLLVQDTPPSHGVTFYFVALSQIGTRRDDPTLSPSVAFATGVHL